MTAIALSALFLSAAVLAIASTLQTWRKHFGRFAELRAELRTVQQGVPVRYTWREAAMPQPSATVYNLRFTPRADCLPFHPEHELLAAA